jgi:hypothetical protein
LIVIRLGLVGYAVLYLMAMATIALLWVAAFVVAVIYAIARVSLDTRQQPKREGEGAAKITHDYWVPKARARGMTARRARPWALARQAQFHPALRRELLGGHHQARRSLGRTLDTRATLSKLTAARQGPRATATGAASFNASP